MITTMATTITGTTLHQMLAEQIARRGDLGDRLTGTVLLDSGRGGVWTLAFDRGAVSWAEGVTNGRDVHVKTDPETLVAILSGERSGIEAFLQGRLTVRGNLALSLKLDGLFSGPDRPVDFPRAGYARPMGLDTFYLEAGTGPPALLLHGLGATNASMLPTLFDLAGSHRVIAPDLPGFGDSAKPIRSYDAAFFARWTLELMDELGIARADLIGNSMGGRVAIEVGLEAPQRLGGIVLLAPSPAFIKRRQFVRLVRFLRPELALIPVYVPRSRVVAGIKRMFSRPERLAETWYQAAADEFVRIFNTPRGRIAFFSAARQIYLEEPWGDTGFWERLPGLTVPSLFVWGERDRLVPAAFGPHVEKALPAARSVVLEDCGHVPQYELPDETHELIRGFLGR
jgi:pimeloyl-ACP methyl ester carboxylesterase/putative sterol carrier protein